MGERYKVEVGPIAHGGHCVARIDGRAVFVRHALPGERVVVVVTEGREDDRFWRADAVEVVEGSDDRVVAPCPYAGPDLCGGCDLQHVDLAAQRRLKASVVAEQVRRLAGVEVPVVVEEVEAPGRTDGLRWRSRMSYIDLPGDQVGLHVHRSSEVVVVEDCRIAAPDALSQGAEVRGTTVAEVVDGRRFEVDADGFWQPHVEAPHVLVDAVLSAADLRAGESVLDLYAGVGLFSRFVAEAVGPRGRVVSVEGDRTASAHAATNLAGLDELTAPVEVVHAPVAEHLQTSAEQSTDVVVLDPPREGAKRVVVEAIAGRRPRAVVYVACDPAALARDVAIFAEHGYVLDTLRAFDLFPMTSHVEVVALLLRSDSGLR